MKAAIITLHSVCNYGTQLQAFATQEKLKQYFDDVELIDYRRYDTYGVGLMRTFTKGNLLKVPLILPTLLYWRKLFGNFRKNYLKLTDKIYCTEESFEDFEDTADVYVVGSDQVWNTGWNNGIIPPLYLSFVPDNKPRFSYSASFGIEYISELDVLSSKDFINKFTAISVREQSGVTILNEQYQYKEAIRIVDPTLAMPPEFWRSYATKCKISGDYILIYNLNRSKEFDRYAEMLADHVGLPLYRFCTRFDQIVRSGKSIVMPEIFDFISLIDNAKYVLTDSFHATAFAMNLNTHPICIYPKNYSGRISDFLGLLDSQQCHVKNYHDFDVVNRCVNFEHVNQVLAQERKHVDSFMENFMHKLIGVIS